MELIKIGASDMDGATVRTVNARDLHAFLEIGKDFSSWIKTQIERGRLLENRDFVKLTQKGELSATGQIRIDYFLTLDAAKHIAMMSGTEKGFQVREYFIECEREAFRRRDPATLTTIALQLIEVNKELEARAVGAETKADSMKVEVAAFERLSKADGLICFTDASKSLGIRRCDLIKWMLAQKHIYRRNGSSHLLAYANKIHSGLAGNPFIDVSQMMQRFRPAFLAT